MQSKKHMGREREREGERRARVIVGVASSDILGAVEAWMVACCDQDGICRSVSRPS